MFGIYLIQGLVDAAAPRTSREPVFFSDVPLEAEMNVFLEIEEVAL